MQQALLSESAMDKLRQDSDAAFWETGLNRAELNAFYANGVAFTIDPSRVEDTITGAIQQSVPHIQELTYFGHIDNWSNVFDYLMEHDTGVLKSINPRISAFDGRVLQLAGSTGAASIGLALQSAFVLIEPLGAAANSLDRASEAQIVAHVLTHASYFVHPPGDGMKVCWLCALKSQDHSFAAAEHLGRR